MIDRLVGRLCGEGRAVAGATGLIHSRDKVLRCERAALMTIIKLR
jgi:hypothetical protein